MRPFERLVADCAQCENRGLIWVGAGDQELACPRCNDWCTLCRTEPELPHYFQRPLGGALMAGWRITEQGLVLFEGYLCDGHKAYFRSYAGIAPAMIGHWTAGAAYIAVQTIFQPHAFVLLYGYGEAHNWHELEADAFQAVALQRRSLDPFGMYYRCPELLAQRAMKPAWAAREEGASA